MSYVLYSCNPSFLCFVRLLLVKNVTNLAYLHLQEFYHPRLRSNGSVQPRIFGMTASPIKTKGMQEVNLLIFHIHFCEYD